MNISLGFELADPSHGIAGGGAVSIPLGHTIVLGQTQKSGKTTTMEALIKRSGVCGIAFLTKRGEKSFRSARVIPPFFRETSVMQPYWKFVCSLIESTQEVRLGMRERGWVMQLCDDFEIKKNEVDEKGKKKTLKAAWKRPHTLRQVLDNASTGMRYSKSLNEMICRQLVEYLKMVVPEIEAAKLSSTIDLKPGINVMDLRALSTSVQALVVRSVVEWVYTSRKRTVVIIPEAWKFLPEGRNTPVSFPVEELIRQGAALKNFVWIDLQDLRGIKKLLLRSVQVWLFGVQKEKNEIGNTLKSMPTPEHKPSANEMMALGIGQFLVSYDDVLRRVYVWPDGMEPTHAQAIAMGQEDAESYGRIVRALDEEKTLGKDALYNETGSDIGDDLADPAEADSATASDGEDGDAAGVRGAASEIPAIVQSDAAAVGAEAGAEDETMWKEKYEALKADHEALLTRVNLLAPVSDEWIRRQKMALREETHEETGHANAHCANTTVESDGHCGEECSSPSMDAIYRYVIARVEKDAADMQIFLAGILHNRPEIEVRRERKLVTLDTSNVKGALALLISEKFFDGVMPTDTARAELIRRGFLGKKTPTQQVTIALESLAEMGFLTREATGYQAVPRMKVNIVEVN